MNRSLSWTARLDVPVAPDADTARRWAREELAHREYSGHGPTLVERFIDWLSGTGGDPGAPDLPTGVLLVIVLVLLAVVLLAFRSAGSVRTTARTRASSAVLEDDARTAAQIRDSAGSAAARGDWSTAVLERYRAVARGLEERAVLDDRPGRTAHEIARDAGSRLPLSAPALARGGALFDDVRYGERVVGPDEDATMRELDTTVAAERPVRPVAPSGPTTGGTAP